MSCNALFRPSSSPPRTYHLALPPGDPRLTLLSRTLLLLPPRADRQTGEERLGGLAMEDLLWAFCELSTKYHH